MYQKKHRPNTPLLVSGLILAAAFDLLFLLHTSLTGTPRLDGVVGIVLGLFICSHPAANALNLLLFHQGATYFGFGRQGYRWWWVLNAVVALAGWSSIFVGTLRFLAR